ncbi:MFS transporter [Rhodococcus sp. LB1]|uniref:MFS transporter n=1 Tax=Rhodococcus sp. LB1 TaxID=1807499 RepID=UPI00077AB439|nr:MFS transporter [Rhodococcus sp. LB1]KXX61323.1 MFS transporter [Rhodococcus sp. LB1]
MSVRAGSAAPPNAQQPVDTPASVPARQPRKAAFASFLGSLVEYYDFFIYGSAAALIFPTVFFPSESPATGTLAALATFGVGYIARPIGAVALGHYGDRIGRKRVLVFTLVLMGVSTFLIGCLPGFGSIGIAAPILLVVLRLMQGASAAGEQSGANSLTLEHSPEGSRAFYTSFTMSGTQAGQLIATLVFIPVAALPEDMLMAWGWRIPFLVSGILTIVALFVRRTMEETPVFREAERDNDLVEIPVVELFENYRLQMVRVIACSLFAVSGTIMTVFALAYGTGEAGLERQTLLWAGVIANIMQLFAIPLWAMLGDKIGRRPVYLAGIVGAIAAFFFYFEAMSIGSVPLIFAVSAFFGAAASGVSGVGPTFFAEMFDTRVRFSGIAISTQIGFAFAGFAPSIGYALLGTGTHGWIPVAAFGSVCLLVAGLSAVTAPETRSVAITELGKK